MKILILCREPQLYSCKRLEEAAERNGHEVDILDPNRCFLQLEDKKQSIFYQPYFYGDSFSLPHYDVVFPRFGITSTTIGCHVLRHLQLLGTYCINNAQAILQTRDKWQSLQILHANGLPIPGTSIAGQNFNTTEAYTHSHKPVIIKTNTGTQGVGVILTENKSSTLSVIETLAQAKIPVLLQKYIPETRGQDIRCFIIGGRIIAAMQRKGLEGEFRANFHRGGNAEQITLTDEEKAMALLATKTMQLDIAGVDLIRSPQGTYVLEVNTSPGLELIEKTTKINIAEQMIHFAEKKQSFI